MLDDKVYCLNQVFRTKVKIPVLPDGWGDCLVCKHDYVNNPKCRGYYPIVLEVFKVEEDYKIKEM